MRVISLVLATLCLAIADLSARSDWVVLENCRLIRHPANDGDSFHISSGDKEYVVRLYLVDAPEIEGTDPRRLIEQAKYFDITVPQAIEVGEAAKNFTQEKLSEPFTVFTRMSTGMGRSSVARVYGFVQTKDGDLGEQLVRNGLARVHGVKTVPPGFDNAQPEIAKLEQFEDAAKKEKIGGWGTTAGRLHETPQDKLAYSFFSKANSSTPMPVGSVTRGKLDINSATKEQLEELPGVGAVLADEIINARPFKSANDLRNVKGIGKKRYEKLRPFFQD